MSHLPAPDSLACCVLIVEASAESREVLRTVLSRRGLQTIDADNAQHGLLLADRHQPAVIVLDLQSDDDASQAVCDQYAASSQAQGSSLVVLGAISRQTKSANHRLVAKPYHYGPLIRTIEQLARRATLQVRGESSAQPIR